VDAVEETSKALFEFVQLTAGVLVKIVRPTTRREEIKEL
jgi:hypothetical protein